MNKVNWTMVIVFSIVVLLAFIVGAGMLGGWGMMGPGMMGRWGYSPFMGVGMIFMWLIPVSLIVLTVLAIVWLARSLGGFNPPSGRTCPNCGRGVQADWQHCPYCGTALQ